MGNFTVKELDNEEGQSREVDRLRKRHYSSLLPIAEGRLMFQLPIAFANGKGLLFMTYDFHSTTQVGMRRLDYCKVVLAWIWAHE